MDKIIQCYKDFLTSCVADTCPSALDVQNGIDGFHLKMPKLLVMLLGSCKQTKPHVKRLQSSQETKQKLAPFC